MKEEEERIEFVHGMVVSAHYVRVQTNALQIEARIPKEDFQVGNVSAPGLHAREGERRVFFFQTLVGG